MYDPRKEQVKIGPCRWQPSMDMTFWLDEDDKTILQVTTIYVSIIPYLYIISIYKNLMLHFAWWSLYLTVPVHVSLCWATSFRPTHQIHNSLPARTSEHWRSVSQRPATAFPAIRAGRVGESLPLTLIASLYNEQHCDPTRGLYKTRLLAVHCANPFILSSSYYFSSRGAS